MRRRTARLRVSDSLRWWHALNVLRSLLLRWRRVSCLRSCPCRQRCIRFSRSLLGPVLSRRVGKKRLSSGDDKYCFCQRWQNQLCIRVAGPSEREDCGLALATRIAHVDAVCRAVGYRHNLSAAGSVSLSPAKNQPNVSIPAI